MFGLITSAITGAGSVLAAGKTALRGVRLGPKRRPARPGIVERAVGLAERGKELLGIGGAPMLPTLGAGAGAGDASRILLAARAASTFADDKMLNRILGPIRNKRAVADDLVSGGPLFKFVVSAMPSPDEADAIALGRVAALLLYPPKRRRSAVPQSFRKFARQLVMFKKIMGFGGRMGGVVGRSFIRAPRSVPVRCPKCG